MYRYPDSYVARPRPLVILSGFAAAVEDKSIEPDRPFKYGPRISTKSPLVGGEYAARLLREFSAFDPGDRPIQTDIRPMHFRVKGTGRTYELPSRKASPSPQSPGSPITASGLHSSLSPISPSSPLFPDGIMHPLWPLKWQELVPAVWISVFSLSADTLDDGTAEETLRNEINDLKSALGEPYHIRLTIVVIGDTSLVNIDNVEERLSSIRKVTKMDAKTGIVYLRPHLSDEELTAFASSILGALRPIAQDFYRDLTKHTRRKKDRGTYPSPSTEFESTVAPTITRSGWTARYEYKLGVFAEFRFEMDAASRHFYAALDALFDSDGVFESLNNWSPRWNEARMFADTIAIRQIRCLLANGLPLPATRFWIKYRDTTSYILNRRGKGTENYGWKAWQARWAKIMAELVQASTGLAIDLIVRKTLGGISPAGKQIFIDQHTDEPVEPWELLHHAGYWFVLAAELSSSRRSLAYAIPEDDRIPPGQSPSTKVARRTEIYDIYLCPEPHLEYPSTQVDGFDHSREIVSTLTAALAEFENREQHRMSDLLKLRIAKELDGASRFQEALHTIKPLWKDQTSWRSSKWLRSAREVSMALFAVATASGDMDGRVMGWWELLGMVNSYPECFVASICITEVQNSEPKLIVWVPALDTQSTGEHVFTQSLATLSSSFHNLTNSRIIRMHAEELESFLEVSFTFGPGEAHASEKLESQVVLLSKLNARTESITLKSLSITFEGGIENIILFNNSANQIVRKATGSYLMETVELQTHETNNSNQSGTTYSGFADLTVRPGMSSVFHVSFVPREAGNIRAITAEAVVQASGLDISYTNNLQMNRTSAEWWLGNAENPRKRTLFRNPAEITIHPKLPKVNIHFSNHRELYYTDELICVDIDVINGEATAVDITLDIRVLGHENLLSAIRDLNKAHLATEGQDNQALSPVELNTLGLGEVNKFVVSLLAPATASNLVLQVKATYAMDSPLTTTSSIDINVARPFDAQYTISPDLSFQPWLNFFHLKEVNNSGQKITQIPYSDRWKVSVKLNSRANGPLLVEKVGLELSNISDGALCQVSHEPTIQVPVTFTVKGTYEAAFTLDASRMEQEDLRTTTVDAKVKVHWSRANSERGKETIVTYLPTPRLTFPTGEPRVLATCESVEHSKYLLVSIILENPSMHFLSFNITLDPDETFVFSGPKSVTKHLVPLSRHAIRYIILPMEHDKFIRPLFKVVDIHFNKSLHISPVGSLRAEPGGLLIWSGPSEVPPMPSKSNKLPSR